VRRARVIKRCYGMTTTLSIKTGVILVTCTERGILLVHMGILLVIGHLKETYDERYNIHLFRC